MVTVSSVGLEIKQEWLRKEFESILADQEHFQLQPAGTSAFPDLLILEMSSADPIESSLRETFGRIRAVRKASPSTHIFLTCLRTDPEILIEALRAEVREFFPQPLKRDEVLRALEKFQVRRSPLTTPAVKHGRLITVMGSKGGTGTTTMTVNLAIALLEADPGKSVVLVDLNPQFGDVALFLDLDPTHTIIDVAQNIDRLDPEFLRFVLATHPSGVQVLPAANAGQELGLVTPERVETILTLLQTLFDYVVIDSGHSLDDVTVATLRLASTFFLVCALDLPSVRNTKRLLDLLSENLKVPKDHIRLIANRYNAKYQEISLREVEEVLDLKACWLIPNDYYTVSRAITRGQPLSVVARRAKVTKSLKRFSMSLVQEADQEDAVR